MDSCAQHTPKIAPSADGQTWETARRGGGRPQFSRLSGEVDDDAAKAFGIGAVRLALIGGHGGAEDDPHLVRTNAQASARPDLVRAVEADGDDRNADLVGEDGRPLLELLHVPFERARPFGEDAEDAA